MESKSIAAIFNNFCLSTTHCRFLCGSSALRSARYVSRVQLYLAIAKLDDTNLSAQLLAKEISRYESAKSFLLPKKKLTMNDLLIAHSKVVPDKIHSGKLRSVEGWVGKSRESATYVAPCPSKINSLLDGFLSVFNSINDFSPEEIVKLYS